MPTLRFATSVPHAGLRFVEESADTDTDRPLEGIHILAPDTEADPDQLRRHLVLLHAHDERLHHPDQLSHLLTHLARAHATALAVPQNTGTPPNTQLRTTAARHGLPLLTLHDDPAAWLRLHQAVAAEHHKAVLRTAAFHRELLDLTRHLGRPDGTQRLVTWLASFADTHVTVTAPGGTVTAAAPAGAMEALRPARSEIAELSGAGRGSASLDTGGNQIRLFTIGESSPAPVLAVAAPAPAFGPETNTAIARLLDLLAVQTASEAAVQRRERLLRGEEAVRRSVLQMLMTGHVTDAQRTAAGVTPGTLDIDACRVFVVKGARAERDAIIRQCVDAIGDGALVSGCPAFPDETIIVVPCPAAAGPGPVKAVLHSLIQGAPDRFVGGSSRHSLAETAQAYVDASRALTVARRVPERFHLYITEVQLAHVLDTRADAWARHRLALLLDLPETRREQLLGTLRLGLNFTPAAAAKILGTHRNTVARRLAEASDLLRTDLQDIVQRAVLGLALEVRARGERVTSPEAGPVAVAQLLEGDEVNLWATQFLERLDVDRRPLRETLAAWIEANTRVDATAAALDLNPATVRAHLRQAERLLQRRLVTGSSAEAEDEPHLSGAHDAVMALAILGLANVDL
ncbi:helix-turn-helix domain-containing protein [Kitasatospora cinereorecta]|uniref:Helix-turn-helix domain-containing protein n=1 Tax=Kitasatospora cinereorecta TaxID=285560 RepID=A0ABW0VMU6_9ACTN